MLSVRVATAALLAGVFIPALFLLPARVWMALCGVIIAGCAWEWASLSGLRSRLAVAGYAAVTGALTLTIELAHGPAQGLYVVAAAFWFLIAPWLLVWRPAPHGAGTRLIAGLVLLPAAGLAMLQLRGQAPSLLLMLMAIVWISDSSAFFCGRAFGRHKLAPAISPGKTWEGVYGALAAVLIYAIICVMVFEHIAMPRWLEQGAGPAVVIGFWVLLAVAGIVGDLVESLLKRTAGVKDSGKLLPGHGGILDRVDALLPLLPIAAIFYLR